MESFPHLPSRLFCQLQILRRTVSPPGKASVKLLKCRSEADRQVVISSTANTSEYQWEHVHCLRFPLEQYQSFRQQAMK